MVKPRPLTEREQTLIDLYGYCQLVEQFFNIDYDYKPFGDAPWLCLNAAADHYLQPVVTELAISRCCDTKKPVGTFRCSCGMIYCRTGPDETEDDKYRIGKIKAYGPILLANAD